MPSLGGKGGNKKQYGKVLSSGLILQYDMQNTNSYSGSGTTVTDIRGSSAATLNNGPTFNSTGTKYLTFDGSNDYLILDTSLNSKLSPINSSTVISYGIWVYPMDNGAIVSELGTTNIPPTNWYDSQIEVVSSTIKFSVWPYTGIITTPTISLNEWYYLVLVYNGTTLRAYMNGSLVNTSTFTRSTPYNDPGRFGLFYGLANGVATNLGDGSYANCRIGAFHVYNIALTAEQVLENFNKTRTIYGV